MIERKYKLKRTKIVGTIGPSSISKKIIRKMILAGLNVCRINFSHSNHEEALKIINTVRELNIELNSHVAIMGDLSGPKLRVGQVEKNVALIKGEQICVIGGEGVSNNSNIFISYSNIANDVKIGEKILIDDGKIILRVNTFDNDKVICDIIQGGGLFSNKGFNLPNTHISIPTITRKDSEDVLFCVQNKIEWVALSFVRRGCASTSSPNFKKSCENRFHKY